MNEIITFNDENNIILAENGKYLKICLDKLTANNFLNCISIISDFAQLDGRPSANKYNIDSRESEKVIDITISGSLITALHDLKSLRFINDEKESELLKILFATMAATNMTSTASLLFYRNNSKKTQPSSNTIPSQVSPAATGRST